MPNFATFRGRKAGVLQAQLYYARQRRKAREAAQKQQDTEGDPDVFSVDFSEDFE